MPTLVSHPDEVKVISRRFGMGAANIDKYIELDGYKAVQQAIAEGPEWIINTMKASGLRGRGGAGLHLSDGDIVGVHLRPFFMFFGRSDPGRVFGGPGADQVNPGSPGHSPRRQAARIPSRDGQPPSAVKI